MQWSSPVVVCVVAVASLQPSRAAGSGPTAGDPVAAQATPQVMNVERAKMGLLPRRGARSRVSYLEGATSPRKVATASSAFDEQPITLVVEDLDEGASAGAVVPAVAAVAAAADAAGSAASAADAPNQPPPTAATQPPAADVAEDATPPAAAVVAQDQTPQTAAVVVQDATPPAAAVVAQDATPPAAANAAEDVTRPPPTEVVEVRTAPAGPLAAAVAVERVIDADGEIIVRVLGPEAAVLGERAVGSLVDLPVLSSQREGDGSVLQTVKDEWGVIEVRRDPVGRFLSASPAEGRVKAD
jgi:hypothetical protein